MVMTPRKIALIVFLLLVATAGLGCAVLSPTVNLLGRLISVPIDLRKADVIVAVSAGKLSDCSAHPNLFLRENTAANLLRGGYSRAGKLIISGIYSRPDAAALASCTQKMAGLLRVTTQQLIIDNTANTTLDNARHVKVIMREHGWRDAVLVTSESHMFRTAHVFSAQGMRVYPFSIPDMPPYYGEWFSPGRLAHLKRFLYEYGALVKYKWYGYW